MAITKFICARWQTDLRKAATGLRSTWWVIGLELVTATPLVIAQIPQAPTQQQQPQQFIARGAIDLRDGPDSVNRVVQRVAKGANLASTGRRFGPWLEVSVADGSVGWLQALDVRASSEKRGFFSQPNNTPTASAQDANSAQKREATTLAPEPLRVIPEATASPEAQLRLSEQRLLQAQTFRSESEEARRFAFQASLERIRIVGKFDPTPPAWASSEKSNTTPDKAMGFAPLAGTGGNVDAVEEVNIGREAALAILLDKPLHSDISLQTYINLLGRWISLESARPDLPWTFAVLDIKTPMVYAIPGGTVLITQGMLAQTTTEAELAGVLAYAIAHVGDRHYLKALANAVSTTPTAGWGNLAGDVYAKGLPVDDEIEADRHAVVMLARSGFSTLAIHKTIQLTGTNALPKPLLASLVTSLNGPDKTTQQRLAQVKTFMDSRFDAYADKPSAPVAQRLAQLNTRPIASEQ